ncbi:MAG: hypothetical protein B6D53_00905 [Candidatus Omnitrophica bacterium 4484_49]|nr:MAG: hypothetical protein B6D53_00905 [Candidatus Omnitrophica bacterium 4484_49]
MRNGGGGEYLSSQLALSTSWVEDKQDIPGLLEGTQEAGYTHIELGFQFRDKELKEVKSQLPKYSLEVVTVHNFCPFPISDFSYFPNPDYFSLSSPDEDERKLAVKYTLGTLETAYELSAKVVILHAGKVDIEDETLKLWEQSSRNFQKFKTDLSRFMSIRNQKAKRFIDSLKFSIEELLKWAQKLNVTIALESRYYLNEIPELEEMIDILSVFDTSFLGYWHDIGHVNVREKLGLYTQMEAITKLEKYLTGFHIHDAQGIDDHKLLGKGDINFDFLGNYRDKIQVLEIHPPVNPQQLRTSRELWERIFYSGKLREMDIKS